MLNEKPIPHPQEVQERIQHGTLNEVNFIATLVGLFMPAMMPSCCKYVEDGANFVNGTSIPKLLEISTDGLLQCKKHRQGRCLSDLLLDHSDAIVEVKCPFPNTFAVNAHYELPIRYVTQILAGMKCKNDTKCTYKSYLQESTTFFKCTFDDDLWTYIWMHRNEEKIEGLHQQ